MGIVPSFGKGSYLGLWGVKQAQTAVAPPHTNIESWRGQNNPNRLRGQEQSVINSKPSDFSS